ncbi:MAG: methyltransferase domain-containing protein [Clostridiales bacterium]|jgi:2-polyprenyl-3-methyl-5-hydroxy-6-metoxy-1,4-benzoquinol methylase|nr:methyltransferase domain-containing protein [Clostridiales bacterium]
MPTDNIRDTAYIDRYYSGYNEDGRLLSPHGQVEFLTTMRYIKKYLEPGMRILEIGAGTGRYSHALARMGYKVDAVELVQANIDIFKDNTERGEDISVRQGDALDLSGIDGETYDIVLLLGPMYHLYNDEDKLKALSEALRVTKTGGLLYIAYCISDASIIGYGFQQGNIMGIIEKGLLDTRTFKTRSTPIEVFELCRKEDIDGLMSRFNTERLHYVATDLYTNYMRDCVDAMDGKTFELYLSYHYAICERPDMAGISHHSLDISRKC